MSNTPAFAASPMAGTPQPDSTKMTRKSTYHIQTQEVQEKKKKLNVKSSLKKNVAPLGFTFLAVGTPALAHECKELSRQRNEIVHIVNAMPERHRDIARPDKVSAHVYRAGYYFRSETLDDACQKLGYVLYRNNFVSASELAQTKRIAEVMSSRGLKMPDELEDVTQVRACMVELFPKMPAKDVDEVIGHAWQRGTFRVGTERDLTLARRVQLAVLARIRHMYTDYEVLLRTFADWRYARERAEPACLAKMKEWRGEGSSNQQWQNETEELETIMREIIVLDDDEEDNTNTNIVLISDDEGEYSDVTERGATTDTSLERVRPPVMAEERQSLRSGVGLRQSLPLSAHLSTVHSPMVTNPALQRKTPSMGDGSLGAPPSYNSGPSSWLGPMAPGNPPQAAPDAYPFYDPNTFPTTLRSRHVENPSAIQRPPMSAFAPAGDAMNMHPHTGRSPDRYRRSRSPPRRSRSLERVNRDYIRESRSPRRAYEFDGSFDHPAYPSEKPFPHIGEETIVHQGIRYQRLPNTAPTQEDPQEYDPRLPFGGAMPIVERGRMSTRGPPAYQQQQPRTVIDLTDDAVDFARDESRMVRQPSRPVHGAPAPVQQMPRGPNGRKLVQY